MRGAIPTVSVLCLPTALEVWPTACLVLQPSAGPSNTIFRFLHLYFVSLGLSHVSPRQQGVFGQFGAWLALFPKFCLVWPAMLWGKLRKCGRRLAFVC